MRAVLLKILAFFLSILNMLVPNSGRFANINQIHQPEAHYAYEEADPTERLAAAAADALYDVDGRNVRFVGGENAVTAAGWTDNGFLYEIILTGQGVTADAMTDYVRATR